MRVHVPIVTQPTVRFLCGGEQVNMAAGEGWIFDTWSLHSVHNDATRARIHLVADTVGGRGMTALMEQGIPPERLKIISYGKEAQVCVQQTEQCWQQNRRAGFTIDR